MPRLCKQTDRQTNRTSSRWVQSPLDIQTNTTGGGWEQSPFGDKAEQTARQTDETGGTSGATIIWGKAEQTGKDLFPAIKKIKNLWQGSKICFLKKVKLSKLSVTILV